MRKNRKFVLTGNVGIGKTCLARQYGEKFSNITFFCDSSKQENLETDLVEYFSPFISNDSNFDTNLTNIYNKLDELAGTTDKPFLFVLDNVQNKIVIESFVKKISTLECVHILVTTRIEDFLNNQKDKNSNIATVDYFEKEEVQLFLHKFLSEKVEQPKRENMMKKLSNMNFPLGLRFAVDALNELDACDHDSFFTKTNVYLFKKLSPIQQNNLRLMSYFHSESICISLLTHDNFNKESVFENWWQILLDLKILSKVKDQNQAIAMEQSIYEAIKKDIDTSVNFKDQNEKFIRLIVKILLDSYHKIRNSDANPSFISDIESENITYIKIPTQSFYIHFREILNQISKDSIEFDAASLADLNKILGYFYMYSKQFNLAVECFSKTLVMQDKKIDLLKDKPSTYDNMGFCYRFIGDNDKQLEYFEKSYALKKELFGDIDHASIAESLFNIGYCHGLMAVSENNILSKMCSKNMLFNEKYILDSKNMFERLVPEKSKLLNHAKSNFAIALYRLSNVYGLRKDYNHQLYWLGKFANKRFEIYSDLLRITYEKSDEEVWDKIEREIYNQSDSIKHHEIEPTNNYEVKCVFDVAFSFEAKAVCLCHIGEFRRAIRNFEHSLFYYEKLFKQPNALKANCLQNLAFACRKHGYYKKHLSYSEELYEMRIKISSEDSQDIARCLLQLAYAHDLKRSSTKAVEKMNEYNKLVGNI